LNEYFGEAEYQQLIEVTALPRDLRSKSFSPNAFGTLCSLSREYGPAVIFGSGCAGHDGLTNYQVEVLFTALFRTVPAKRRKIRLVKEREERHGSL
jgi:hypothetical protein